MSQKQSSIQLIMDASEFIPSVVRLGLNMAKVKS